jgi:hypothetical protein
LLAKRTGRNRPHDPIDSEIARLRDLDIETLRARCVADGKGVDDA